jgi:DNA repair protein RadC
MIDFAVLYASEEEVAVLRRATEILVRLEALQAGPSFHDPGVAIRLSRVALAGRDYESFGVWLLDNQNAPILPAPVEVFRGTMGAAAVYPRDIVLLALRYGAASVVFVHNHPSLSSSPVPSEADLAITRRLVAALNLVDVRVIDHIIVARNSALSMAVEGVL